MGVNRIIWGSEAGGEFFAFDDMIGSLQPKLTQAEVIVQKGTDGERIRTSEVRAAPSSIVTEVFVADLATSIARIALYEAEIDGAAKEVKQYGESFGNFRILGFQVLPYTPVGEAVGHVLGGTVTFVERIRWTLLGTT